MRVIVTFLYIIPDSSLQRFPLTLNFVRFGSVMATISLQHYVVLPLVTCLDLMFDILG